MNVPQKSAVNLSTPIKIEAGGESRWHVEESDDVVIIRDVRHAPSGPQPEDWRERLKAYFQTIPSLAAVGAKRVTPAGQVMSMGELVLHPKGFHHLGQGMPATCYRFPEEVDVLSGGLIMVRREAYEEAGGKAGGETGRRVGGLDVALGDLALIDLGLKLRRAGGRCLVVPDVVIETSMESTPAPTAAQAKAFYNRWKFDWIAPDLDDVSATYATTGLLWNVRFWGCAMPFEKYVERPAVHWNNYVEVEPYRERANHLTEVVAKLTPAGLAVDLGCGDGLYAHLLAMRGIEVMGIDPEEAAINQARERTNACTTYPGLRPRFELGTGTTLPLENETAQTVFMLDVIEHLPNPIRILREAARTIKPGGHLFVTTPAAQFGGSSDPTYHLTEYSPAELDRQINAVPSLNVISRGNIGGVYRDILIAAQKQ